MTRWLLIVVEGGAERVEHVFKYFIVPIEYVGWYSMCFEAPASGTIWGQCQGTVLLRSIRPSRVPGLGGLDEIGPMSQVTAHLASVRIWFKNRSKRAHFIKKRSCSRFLETYDKWRPTRRCVAKGRPRARNRGHKFPLLQTMTTLLHYNFFMCGKGLNYIDLRSVLAIDRLQGVQ